MTATVDKAATVAQTKEIMRKVFDALYAGFCVSLDQSLIENLTEEQADEAAQEATRKTGEALAEVFPTEIDLAEFQHHIGRVVDMLSHTSDVIRRTSVLLSLYPEKRAGIPKVWEKARQVAADAYAEAKAEAEKKKADTEDKPLTDEDYRKELASNDLMWNVLFNIGSLVEQRLRDSVALSKGAIEHKHKKRTDAEMDMLQKELITKVKALDKRVDAQIDRLDAISSENLAMLLETLSEYFRDLQDHGSHLHHRHLKLCPTCRAGVLEDHKSKKGNVVEKLLKQLGL